MKPLPNTTPLRQSRAPPNPPTHNRACPDQPGDAAMTTKLCAKCGHAAHRRRHCTTCHLAVDADAYAALDGLFAALYALNRPPVNAAMDKAAAVLQSAPPITGAAVAALHDARIDANTIPLDYHTASAGACPPLEDAGKHVAAAMVAADFTWHDFEQGPALIAAARMLLLATAATEPFVSALRDEFLRLEALDHPGDGGFPLEDCLEVHTWDVELDETMFGDGVRYERDCVANMYTWIL